MGNNWKITDTLTKVFADEVPDGQGSIRLSTLHRETVSCVIAYFGTADWLPPEAGRSSCRPR